MGRLSALTAIAAALVSLVTLALAAGCEPGKSEVPPPPPTSGRSNAVGASTHAAVTSTVVTARPTAPKAPRQLCAGGTGDRQAPRAGLRTASADGTPVPPQLSFGVGKWVWVNLWAAWCGPCKEEMPRLLDWQTKLRKAGVLLDLAFVSIDDDERQLQRFLEGQPSTGVRASYWLPDSPARATWLGDLGVRESPELPVQALVAPNGTVACVIQGAVEDSDYPALLAFVSTQR